MAEQTNPTLAQQKATHFQGETLRDLLLTSGYGFGAIGEIAGIAAYFATGHGMVLVVVAGILRYNS